MGAAGYVMAPTGRKRVVRAKRGKRRMAPAPMELQQRAEARHRRRRSTGLD